MKNHGLDPVSRCSSDNGEQQMASLQIRLNTLIDRQ